MSTVIVTFYPARLGAQPLECEVEWDQVEACCSPWQVIQEAVRLLRQDGHEVGNWSAVCCGIHGKLTSYDKGL